MPELRVGVGKATITPDVGCELAGYGSGNISTGVHDDLHVRALALEMDGSRCLLACFDILGFDRAYVLQMAEACEVASGVPSDHVVLTASHTHSGPHVRSVHGHPIDAAYVDRLVSRTAEAAARAFEALRPADLRVTSRPVRESINRRVILEDGSYHYWPSLRHLTPNAIGPVDDELGVLAFDDPDSGERIATLANYTAHPLCVGNSSMEITADYPAHIVSTLEERVGGTALFSNGACGDIHPLGSRHGFGRAMMMGEHLGKVAAEASGSADKREVESIAICRQEVTFPLRPEAVGEDSKYHPRYRGQTEVSSEIVVLALGDVAFVGSPGELLVGPGLAIKWSSPFYRTYILYNSTDYLGYIPLRRHYEEGGYEPGTMLAPGCGERVIEVALDMVREVEAR